MGLFTDLLLLPVTGPYRGLRFLLESIQERANAEFFDPSRIQADLMALGLRLDSGELSEDEYLDAEAILLERLNQARAVWEEPGTEFDEFDAEASTGDNTDTAEPNVSVETRSLDAVEPDATRP